VNAVIITDPEEDPKIYVWELGAVLAVSKLPSFDAAQLAITVS
jgi:hypothetical protein